MAPDTAPPRVLHSGYHPEVGGGYTDLLLRVDGRRQAIGVGNNPVMFVDSPRCSERARIELDDAVSNCRVLGPGSVSYTDLALAPLTASAGIRRMANFAAEHRVDVLHANTFRAGLVCAVLSLLADYEFVMHVHHPALSVQNPRLRRFIFGAADEIIHVSDYTRRLFDGDGNSHRIIRSPIDIEKLENTLTDPERLRTEFDVGDDLVVSLVARMAPNKGHRNFLRAAESIAEDHPDVTFLVVGGGGDSYRQELREEFDVEGGNVVFTGFVESIESLYELTDIVAVPSRDDNLPKVIQEALVFDCAVVASDTGGIPELVADGETGLLVPELDDGTALADAIERLVNDSELRERLRDAGYERLRAEFDTPVVVEDFEALYAEILSS
ncbi:glycosyltransferase family 4 protein [Halogeometricum pallidum]|uniref:glycosyltransferase family 4 protein n=1 Tax=Halogeometricum pallidum TaxID=411361 RepID=UPI000A024136|nr:glycosyltransferase family 4 protein [Halogeometricum pallidum]